MTTEAKQTECSCGSRFLDAEDYRDHLPCPGSAVERAYARGFEAGRAAAFSESIAACEEVNEAVSTAQGHSAAYSARACVRKIRARAEAKK